MKEGSSTAITKIVGKSAPGAESSTVPAAKYYTVFTTFRPGKLNFESWSLQLNVNLKSYPRKHPLPTPQIYLLCPFPLRSSPGLRNYRPVQASASYFTLILTVSSYHAASPRDLISGANLLWFVTHRRGGWRAVRVRLLVPAMKQGRRASRMG
jgi:hypothetical protein